MLSPNGGARGVVGSETSYRRDKEKQEMTAVAQAGAAILEELISEYQERTPGSAAAHCRASGVLPGGETRSVTHYPPYPVAMAEGSGARLVDLDGNEYLDLVNNYTSLIHGNAYAPATMAAVRTLAAGSVFPSTHRLQVELAELLIARVPSVERVRFTNSGTEANILAARLAKHVTGRGKLLLFEGGYHGSAPSLLPGGPDVVTAPYNDVDAVRAALSEDIAAVFAEPFLGAGGVIPSGPGFLRAVQELAHASGALFVLDEVQSLRNAVGGEQSRLGLRPDITSMGKIIGGGLPIGAIGGSAELMAHAAATAPGHLVHSGTFNGHLAAVAAGAVNMRDLDQQAIDRLERFAATLASGIGAAASRAGLGLSVTRAGSILNVHFSQVAPTTAAEAHSAAETSLLPALHLALLAEGVYTAPRGMLNLSTALRAEDVARTIDAYDRAFARLAA
jgi:glutamate-1-semialdehyde 2,1-aminomutase